MLNDASYTNDCEWGDWRPLREHAGEVTKKERSTNSKIQDQPPAQLTRIGGARNILQSTARDKEREDSRSHGQDAGQVSREKKATQSNIALVTEQMLAHEILKIGETPDSATDPLADASSNVSSTRPGGIEVHLESVISQRDAGWREYWATLTYGQRRDWLGSPNIKVSDRCYECRERLGHCSAKRSKGNDDKIACRDCHIFSRPCLFMISYRRPPDEDWDVIDVPQGPRQRSAQHGTPVQKTSATSAGMQKIFQSLLRAASGTTGTTKPSQSDEMARQTAISQRWEPYKRIIAIRTTSDVFEDRRYTAELVNSREHHPLLCNIPLPPGIPRACSSRPAEATSPLRPGTTMLDIQQPEHEEDGSPWQYGKVERCLRNRQTLYVRLLTCEPVATY
jgi:hypothetical protein